MQHTGPTPSTPNIVQVVGLSGPRLRVLEAIENSTEPSTVKSVAKTLKLHPNTVRSHIDALVDSELVKAEPEAPDGRGRPAHIYRTTAPRGVDTNSQVTLLNVILSVLRESLDDEQSDQAALEIGKRWSHIHLQHSVGAGREGSIPILANMGFPAYEAQDGFHITHCPLLTTGNTTKMLICRVHQGLVDELAARDPDSPEKLTVVPFAGDGYCLVR